MSKTRSNSYSVVTFDVILTFYRRVAINDNNFTEIILIRTDYCYGMLNKRNERGFDRYFEVIYTTLCKLYISSRYSYLVFIRCSGIISPCIVVKA